MNWIVLNYDLGLRGEYESLYKFLDNHNAIDCGNSTCAFEFPFTSAELSHKEKLEEVKKSLDNDVDFKKGDRIYCIVHNKKGIPQGSFLYGHRQSPVWEGYGNKKENDDLPF